MPTITQSSRNPFRNQGSQAQSSTTNEPSTSFVSPTPTGDSASSTPASSTTPNDHLINDLPSSSSTSAALSTDVLDEELPPAYTLAPDSSHGEQTVEYGPRRPFQNPPTRPVPPQHSIPAQSTGWSTIQSHVTHPSPPPPSQPQSLWQQITGHLADQLTGLSSDSYSSRYGTYPTTHNTGYSSSFPPPSQSTWTSQTAPNSIEPPPLPPRRDTSQISPTSEFARDFYAAGAGPPPDHNESTRYPPPPGPPPGSPPSGSPRTSDDDGRPTKTPVPGHPLLNHGRLLVYPPGFECDKCHNVGYKQNDPSNPCRKCWSKYAKPFSGAITYSSFKSSSAGTGKTFQRPLPVLRPPQAGIARQQHHHGYPGSAYVQNRGQEQNSYTTRPPGSYAPHSQPPQQPPPNIQVAPGGYSSYGPPPGSVVYAPGDPRLGGRLCWRCDGDGTIGAFLFQEQCSVCAGLGRTYN